MTDDTVRVVRGFNFKMLKAAHKVSLNVFWANLPFTRDPAVFEVTQDCPELLQPGSIHFNFTK